METAVEAAPALDRRESASSDSDAGARLAGDASDARDSGVEADAFAPPDEATARALAEAVEFYFSDENLLKDAFLLKHVKRNKEGFVSLKLLSSFKRVKHVSRDWRVVAFAVRHSVQLEVNEEGTKVRRLQPLPEHDETVTSRTVVAVNLPLENPTIASVSELFGKCGDISSIRVLKPGTTIPVEVRAAFNKHPEVEWEGVNCAVIEFDLQEQAKRAKETMSAADPTDTSGMHILPIGKVSNKKKSRQEEPRAALEELTNLAEKKRRQKRKKTSLVHMESSSSMSGTDGECFTPIRRLSAASVASQPSQRPPLLPLPPGFRQHRMSPPSRPGGLFACTDIRLTMERHIVNAGKSFSSPNVIPQGAAAARQQKGRNSFCGVVPANSEQCPWVVRRKASGLSDADRRGSLMAQENVTRAPRGPDGSRGFVRPKRRSAALEIKAPPVEDAPSAPAPAPAPAAAPAPAPAPAPTPAPALAADPVEILAKTSLSPAAPPFVPASFAAVAAAPVPVSIKPAPVTIKPAPVSIKPAPVTIKPVPVSIKPAPTPATAEAKPTEAKPAPTPAPTEAKPAPTPAPTEAKPAPTPAPTEAKPAPATADEKSAAAPATAEPKAAPVAAEAPAEAKKPAPAETKLETKPEPGAAEKTAASLPASAPADKGASAADSAAKPADSAATAGSDSA